MGYLPSYIQYDTVSLTLIRDESTQLQCVLVHDVADGQVEDKTEEREEGGREGERGRGERWG